MFPKLTFTSQNAHASSIRFGAVVVLGDVAESDDKIVQAKWHPSDFTFVATSADKTATLWALPTE